MKRVLLSLAAFGLASLATAQTDDSYRHGYLRTVEAGVTLQRADEPAAEVAVANAPFLPGDRIWTDEAGRLEIQFADGSVLRVDNRSKLDYVAHEGGRRSERVVLRLWSGSVYLHYRDGRRSPEFTVETPEAVFEPAERGAYRLDVSAGEARLLVFDGEATLEAGRRAKVQRGEQARVREGELYGEPERFEAYDADDDFARWDQHQQEQLAYAEERQEDLPEEVLPYAADFGVYGSWDVHQEYGRVWYPQVASGWRPYSQGYWDWTPYGWTWIPNERWGWATSHYGRWGYWPSRGWYWIPGRSWGPGWVSWARGGDYVGWCPLGFGDRPVVIHERNHGRRQRGNAVPRGSRVADGATFGSPWFYVRRADMGGRDLARRRVDPASVTAAEVRVAQTARHRLSRDLRIVEGSAAAAPRHVSTRPGPGDTVPELRSDPMTTIRRAIPRRRRDPDEERPTDPAADGERRAPGVRAPRAPLPSQSPWSTDATASPRQDRAPAQPDARHWSEREATRRAAPRQRPEAERQDDDQRRDREPLRPLFRGFSRSRSDENGSSGSSDEARPRGESRPGWSRPRGEDSGSSRPRSGDSGASRPRGGSDRGSGRSDSGGAGFSRPRPERSGGGEAPRATAPPSGSRSQPQRDRAQPREHARPRKPEN
jgi:hypothetical protein